MTTAVCRFSRLSLVLSDTLPSVAGVRMLRGPLRLARLEQKLVRNRGLLTAEKLAEYEQALNIYRPLTTLTRDNP